MWLEEGNFCDNVKILYWNTDTWSYDKTVLENRYLQHVLGPLAVEEIAGDLKPIAKF